MSNRESLIERGCCLDDCSSNRGDGHRELNGDISALESSRLTGGSTSREEPKEKFSSNMVYGGTRLRIGGVKKGCGKIYGRFMGGLGWE